MKTCSAPIECNNPVFSHGFCARHQHLRRDQKWIDSQNKQHEKKKGYSTIKQKPHNATGEGVLFAALINTRPHVSFISGLPIPDISYQNCAHILPKGQNKYPRYKLLDRNIVFLTMQEHFLYDSGTEKKVRRGN